jgi:hypothetical protein
MASKEITLHLLGKTIKPAEGHHKMVKLKSTQKYEGV